MSKKTTADLLVERLADGAWTPSSGSPATASTASSRRCGRTRRDQASSGAPRGGGRLRRVRLRQVHRPARRLPRDLGPGRHPPAQRPLRRQVRRPAGAGHHRPHLPRPDRHALPAGRRSRQAVHGRRRVQRAGHGAGARRQRRRRGDPDRARRGGPWRTSRSRRTSRSGRPTTEQRSGANVRATAPTSSTPQRPAAAGDAACRRPRSSSTPARRSPSSPAAAASARATRCWSWPSESAAPIVKPLLGKAVVPDDSPYTTGGIGLLGTAPSQDAMEECDTLHRRQRLSLHGVLPEAGPGEGVQIDIDPTRIGLRYPVDVGLVGDCRTVLARAAAADRHARATAASSSRRRSDMKELARADGGARHARPTCR